MITIFQEARQIFAYIGTKITVAGLKTYPLYFNTRVGGIHYYGPQSTIKDFQNALTIELPKYDVDIIDRILSSKIKIDVLYHNTLYIYTPAAGAFSIPSEIFNYGAEGICQYLVYCVLGAESTGVGLAAAIRLAKRKTLTLDCMNNMQAWIKEKHFPEKWLSSYNYEENLAAMKNIK